MQILLDTHIYLWWLKDDKNLSKKARELICNAENVFVSAASLIELAIKISSRKLTLDIGELIDEITANGFKKLSLTVDHSKILATLPYHHYDPFDRMLIAQALSEPLLLITSDKKLQPYSDLVTLV